MKGIRLFFAFIIAVLILQSFLANLFRRIQEYVANCEEYSQSLETPHTAMNHQRSWRDHAHSQRYCMNFDVKLKHFGDSKNNKKNVETILTESYAEYWGAIYQSLYAYDSSKLLNIKDSLHTLAKQQKLNKSEFAHMVVKFVQDIPYSYVISESCDGQNYNKPCSGNQRFGINSPVEFLYTLKGDCDTRTVLLFGILKEFGFDPLILISREYLHSMLALDIPASGEFISFQGRKFYFWETTNTGWEPGMLAPDMQNVSYWDVALF